MTGAARTVGVVALVAATLTACAGDDDFVPPAVSGRSEKINPNYTDFELPGPNVYFFCDGAYGVYVTEGSNNDSGKSAAPFVIANHTDCGTGSTGG